MWPVLVHKFVCRGTVEERIDQLIDSKRQLSQDLPVLAEDSVAAANRTTDAILDACDLLVDHPHIGHARTDLTDRPVLFWASGKYLYRLPTGDEAASCCAVLHASRDVATLLTDRE